MAMHTTQMCDNFTIDLACITYAGM